MSSFFSEYSRNARIAPVLVATLPALSVCWYAPEIGVAVAAIPFLFVASTGLLAEQIVRYLGKRLEERLALEWTGLPTVRALRHRGGANPTILKKRRAEVEQISGIKLPTRREENGDNESADEIYDDAVRRCLAVVGDKEQSPRLFVENVHYGFRRNLLALKPFGLAIAVISGGIDGILAAQADQTVSFLVFLVLLIGICCIWLVFVRTAWVRAQAETFAQRFFLTLGMWT